MINFSKVDIVNGGHLILSKINLEIKKGEFVFIVGEVGSGKTSIIKSLIAEIPIKVGEAIVGKFNITKLKNREIPYLRRSIGVVFQDFKLLTDRTVYENLEFVLKATGWKSPKAHKMPHQLSGGEQQRIAIARALLNNPELILADEPTANLDSNTTKEIMELILKIHKENSPTIVMVTHNQNLIKNYPARTLVCKNQDCIDLNATNSTDSEHIESAEELEIVEEIESIENTNNADIDEQEKIND